jgi:quaternary ammonium compound-resistance protein SugE
MAWLYLFIAGLFEVSWAISLKYTLGWTRLVPSILTIVLMIASFYFLSIAIKVLPIGTSYAVWTGIGTVGTAIFGIIILKEQFDILKLFCILLIISGIVGLKLLSKS